MLIKFLKQTWLVMAAALVFGLLVSGIFGQLNPRIRQNAREKLEREMKKLLAAAVAFEPVFNKTDPKGEQVLYYVGKNAQGSVVGYAMESEGSGFADKIKLLVTFEADLEHLLGYAVLKSNETPGFGDKIKDSGKEGQISFKDQFVGCPIDKKLEVEKTGDINIPDEKIIAITGATVSSEAVTKVINDSVKRIKERLKSQTPETQNIPQDKNGR